MARTKASVGAKVASGKSSKARCVVASAPSSSGSSGTSERPPRSYSGGNSVCSRETPKWQRPITNFFITKDNSSDSDDGVTAGTSKSRPKRNTIQSDDEETPQEQEQSTKNRQLKPKNHVLDESIELEPLNGDDSHKIDEYYTKNGENQIINGENLTVNGENLTVNLENQSVNGENQSINKEKHKTADQISNGETHDNNNEEMSDKNKIEENYPQRVKGKGQGKKTKNKENEANNERKSVKRELEEINLGGESEQMSKKVKVM